MHKPSLALCLLALLTFSVPALAQAPGGGAPGSTGAPGATGAPGGGAPGATAASSGTTAAAPGEQHDGAQGGPGGQALSPEKFAEMKGQIGKRIDGIIGELQKRKACIEAAANMDGIRACGGPAMGGPGGHHGMMPPPGGAPEGEQKK